MLITFSGEMAVLPGLLATIFGVLGGLLAANGLWPYARIDAQGITWRNWRGTYRARWDEITDFYEVLPKASAGRNPLLTGSAVVTQSGDTLHIPLDWVHRDVLRKRIVDQAINASVPHTSDEAGIWLPQGARLADFPVTFGYDKTLLRKERESAVRWILAGVLPCLIPCALAVAVLFDLNIASSPIGLLIVLGILLLPVVGILIYLGLKFRRSQQARRDALARAERDERFVANAQGLTFFMEGEGRTLPWDSIVGYDFALPTPTAPTLEPAPLCRIRSADGREFQFTNRISQFPLLQYLLRNLAPEAVEARKDNEQKEALGGIAARWTGGEEGKGDRVYHCRTRTLRNSMAIHGFMGGLGLVMTIVRIIEWLTSAPRPVPQPGLHWIQFTVYLFFLPVFVFSALRYMTEKIIFRKEGIARRFARTEEFILWEEIKEVREEGGFLHVQGKNGQKISFIPSAYAYGSEIKERIAEYRRPYVRRVTQADVPDSSFSHTILPTPAAQDVDMVQVLGRIDG